NRTQNPTTTQEGEGVYAIPAPQKPPRMRGNSVKQKQPEASLYDKPALQRQQPTQAKNRTQNNAAPQESEPIYAEMTIKTPLPTKKRERRGTITQKEETIYTTVASARISTAFSKEEIILKIRNNPLVQTCKDEIRTLSQTVYGDQDIFQKKLEEIEKNPILGESLSWQVAANPKLVANFAGKKIFGIKDQTRKEAEENISSLCLALENYAAVVKQAKENILHGHLAGQVHHKNSLDLKQIAKDLQKPRKAEQEETTLSHKEIVRRVKSNTAVQYCHAEIVYWCTIAFGDPRILQYRLEEVHKSPAMGEELSWQVTTHPHTFGKLAGRNFSGIKNQARKEAENALTRLGEAIEGYAEAVKHAKEHILQSQEEKQKRNIQSPEQEKSMQRQQSLSKPPQHPKRPSADKHQEAVETVMQTEWEKLGAKPRTLTTPQRPTQQTQESILPTSHTEQKMQKEQTAEKQQKLFTAKKARAPLSHKEISEKVQSDHSVQRARIEICNWCNIVYGNPFILQHNTEDVQKVPVLGEELSWQVVNQPTMFAPLAGKKMFGIKNQARKHAEEAVPSLCAAIDDYTKIVKKVREEIVKTYQEQSIKLDEDMQKQQNLSQSPQLLEHSPKNRHQEPAENSMQAEKSPPSVRPRKVTASTTISFAG
ncbi:hypothetical protein ME7_01560, partial [Bartonella birtlesii LL-WM9]